MPRMLMRGEPAVFPSGVVDSCSKKSKVEQVKTGVFEGAVASLNWWSVVQKEDLKGPRLKFRLPESRDVQNLQTYGI